MAERPTLVLVDGHALAFRAFHALKDSGLAVRSTGEPTYAIHGFFQILLSLLQERQPKYVAVSFDVGRTFRDELYAEYKAGRGEAPVEFHPQLERIQQIIRALNIPIYTAEGYEADDVIGTLCRQAEAQNVNTLIITGDTDTLQLVNDYTNVLLANPYGRSTTTTLYDETQVRDRYKGLRPDQLADLRGLKGDASDNIPGVKGIGEAGAISLLNEFGTVEDIYKRLDEVPKRYRSKLEGQQETALFSKHLATIVCDVPVQLDLAATIVHDYNRSEVLALFSELGFRRLVEKLPIVGGGGMDVVELPPAPPSSTPAQLAMFAPAPAPAPAPVASDCSYTTVADPQTLDALVRELQAASLFAFDAETTTTNLYGPDPAQLVGISLAAEPGTAWYIPLGHREGQQLDAADVAAALQPLFSDASKGVVGHNAKFDIEALSLIGLEVGHITFDTMIAAGLLGEKMGLKDLAFQQLKDADDEPITMTNIEELIGRGKQQITMAEVGIDAVTPYACADADMTLRLMHAFAPRLAEHERLQAIFQQIELPLIPVLMRMEQAGIGVDAAQLREQGTVLGAILSDIEQQVHAVAGDEINLQSRYDLNDLLFRTLNLPTQGLKKLKGSTKTGGDVYSITADVLDGLAEHDESGVVQLILRQRQLNKLKSTYIDALQTLVNPLTNRIHTQFRQMGTATGRISSDSPNLQNIPVRSEEGREIRKAFVAAPGHQLLAADYSQIELRILAHVTQDPPLVEVFRTGQDIHASTAANLFDVPIDQVSKNQRRIAKMTIFGVIYGISSFGLSARTSLNRTEAQELINSLFERYPGLRAYIDQTVQLARAQGYVETLFGRRRYFPELRDNTAGMRRQAAEREAINAPIQGTAADLIKMAMVQLDHELREQGLGARMLLQVHDELLLEVPDAELTAVTQLVCRVMEGVYPELRVPLEVNIEAGPNWYDVQPITTR